MWPWTTIKLLREQNAVLHRTLRGQQSRLIEYGASIDNISDDMTRLLISIETLADIIGRALRDIEALHRLTPKCRDARGRFSKCS